jgi:hypothetical protein
MNAYTFTDTRILNIHGTKSYWECICVCGCWCDFKVFPLSVSFKCSVSKNAIQHASQKSLISVWLKFAIPKISCYNLSGEEMYSIH